MTADPTSASYPVGHYAFDTLVEDLPTGCTPSLFEPHIPTQRKKLVGSMAAGGWTAAVGASGFLIFSWVVGPARYEFSWTNGIFSGNGPALWDPIRGVFTCSLTHPCAGGGPRTYRFTLVPSFFSSWGLLRAYLDEATQSSSELLRWSEAMEIPPLCSRVTTHRTTAIWGPHTRGRMSKLGSSGLPRAAGQQIDLDFS